MALFFDHTGVNDVINKKQRLISIGLSLLLFVTLTKGVWATTDLIKDYSKNNEELMLLQKQGRIASEIAGEIVAINQEYLELKRLSISKRFKISASAVIYCNGYISCWEALTPVSQGAYFEARVYLDVNEEAILIHGFYYGEEGIIQNYQWIDKRLQLDLVHPQNGRRSLVYVSPQAALPEGDQWLRADQPVYVLYDMNDEIRKLVLPD